MSVNYITLWNVELVFIVSLCNRNIVIKWNILIREWTIPLSHDTEWYRWHRYWPALGPVLWTPFTTWQSHRRLLMTRLYSLIDCSTCFTPWHAVITFLVAQSLVSYMEFNVSFQHKYGFIRVVTFHVSVAASVSTSLQLNTATLRGGLWQLHLHLCN